MFKILNKTVISWPEDSTIENDCADIAQSEKKFSFNVKQRQYGYLTIHFKIPEMCDEQNVKITFFFTSQRKGNIFGQSMIVELLIQRNSKVELNM